MLSVLWTWSKGTMDSPWFISTNFGLLFNFESEICALNKLCCGALIYWVSLGPWHWNYLVDKAMKSNWSRPSNSFLPPQLYYHWVWKLFLNTGPYLNDTYKLKRIIFLLSHGNPHLPPFLLSLLEVVLGTEPKQCSTSKLYS